MLVEETELAVAQFPHDSQTSSFTMYANPMGKAFHSHAVYQPIQHQVENEDLCQSLLHAPS